MWPFWDSTLHAKIKALTAEAHAADKKLNAILTGLSSTLQQVVSTAQVVNNLTKDMTTIMWQLSAIEGRLNSCELLLESNQERLKRIARRLGPGQLLFHPQGESFMSDKDQILFNVTLPQPGSPDITSRELAVSVDGSEFDVQLLPASALEVIGLSGPQDSNVVVRLVDIDDAGNRSEPATLSAQLLDVFPPAKPGELGLVMTGERHPEPPADEPPADEPPADEPPADEPPADEEESDEDSEDDEDFEEDGEEDEDDGFEDEEGSDESDSAL